MSWSASTLLFQLLAPQSSTQSSALQSVNGDAAGPASSAQRENGGQQGPASTPSSSPEQALQRSGVDNHPSQSGLSSSHGHDLGSSRTTSTAMTTTATTAASDMEQGNMAEDDPAAETLASAAASLRVSHVEMQTILSWVTRTLPGLMALLFFCMIQHLNQVLQLMWAAVSLYAANKAIRKQASLRHELQIPQTLGNLMYVVTNTAACVYLTDGLALLPGLALRPALQTTVLDTTLAVAVLDCLAGLLLCFLKLLLLLAHTVWTRASLKTAAALSAGRPRQLKAAHKASARQQAHLLCLAELLGRIYRHVLPLPLWMHFLTHHATPVHALACVAAGSYATCKLGEVLQVVKDLRTCAMAWWQHGGRSGMPASKEDLQGVGGQCPVCQDTIEQDAGTRLQCSHVYCEACINEWLERHRTCPICRAEVKVALPQGCGSDGGTSALPSIF